MPHFAAAAINHWVAAHPTAQIRTLVLGAPEVTAVRPGLESDASSLLYSAQITLLDAIRGMQTGYFTWSIVKCYYCAFYAVRSILAGNSIALFYPQQSGTPYSLQVSIGQSPRKESGATHKVVWNIFRREFPNYALNNTIGLNRADDWLKDLRETLNYRNARFVEPLVPSCLAVIDRIGLIRSLDLYRRDTTLLYSFDEDHAILAFPLECVRRCQQTLATVGIHLDANDTAHVESCLIGCGLPRDFFATL